MGELNHEDCPSWSSNIGVDKIGPEKKENDIAFRVPWSSSALGSSDLSRLYQQGPSIFIGLLGAQNTGKTTFLAANYLQLLSGKKYNNFEFCGSQTLGAWESIASWARINNEKQLPSFPPHTPRGVDRTPGILHFALQDSNDKIKNIFLTDAPGEWFTRWAIDVDAIDAAGAKWTASQSDAFLIFADCEKLAGEERSVARRELRTIIERLGESVGSRPTVLVWAKSDKQPSEGIKKAIQRALENNIHHAKEIEVTVEDPASFTIALGSILNEVWVPTFCEPIKEPILGNTSFLAFRGHHEKF
ncbi:hypothetical protein R7Q46_21175 [Vibrio sp. 811]|uniref:TRAFAC clade GTPase domain-containing protein n=1 Tax=Vibrio sp. 811 TaxID=3074616 RepID=UPI002964CBEF|nr:hypothetical protein [Vibrio sp. 811]MDW1986916.1 hypothetical protein [Vibrio sp. 811]